MRKLFRIICGSALLLATSLPCLTAETVSYPDDRPVFTVAVPEGWEVRHEHGAVRIIAQANAVFALQHVDNVSDDDTAPVALAELASLQGKQFALEEMKVVRPTAPIQMGDFKGFITECVGKDKHGNDTFWQMMIFSPKDKDYYVATCLWTKDDAEKTAADRVDIFKSLKAVP